MRSLLLLSIVTLLAACATPSARYERVDEVVAFQAAPLGITRDGAAAAISVPSVPAFQFTCDTTARRITPPSGPAQYREITVWNAACVEGTCTTSSTPLFLGGRYDTDGPVEGATLTNETGMPICNSSGCIAPFVTYVGVPNVDCIAGSLITVTVQVLQ